MIHKPSVHWQKITEVLPEPDQECLVWTGHYMIVATAHFYDDRQRKEYANLAIDSKFVFTEKEKLSLINCRGRFVEFGQNHYFDDPKVQWSPVPLAPGEENPPLPDPFEGMEEKSVYLKKYDPVAIHTTIIGLHAIGYPEPHEYDIIELDGTKTRMKSDFMAMEAWGNQYDEDHKMLGGSFRLGTTNIEEEAKELEKDGWVIYEGPKRKEKT